MRNAVCAESTMMSPRQTALSADVIH